MLPLTVVHLLTYNSSAAVMKSVESVLAQHGFELGVNLILEFTDNASTNGIADQVEKVFGAKFPIYRNRENLGFCGAQNQAVYRFLKSGARYLLLLNPDAALEPSALSFLVNAIETAPDLGIASPLLLRGDAELTRLEPPIVDAAGMRMTRELRHLDRGSGEVFNERYAVGGEVFGGSGACLLLRRDCVEDLLLDGGEREADVDRLYPQLARGRNERSLLFDEAFFAYREDADLAWRAQHLGWRTIFVPEARGVHERRVVPEKRAALPPELNRLGVRNRFLLQGNNLTWQVAWVTLLWGVVTRNLLVLFGVVLRERTSLSAFRDLFILWGRARARRRAIKRRLAGRPERASIAPWFAGHELGKVQGV